MIKLHCVAICEKRQLILSCFRAAAERADGDQVAIRTGENLLRVRTGQKYQ